MKKYTLFILIGITILLAVTWIVLVLTRDESTTPATNSDLTSGGTIEDRPFTQDDITESEQPRLNALKLQKLVDKDVAGITLLKQGDTTYVRYVERGTGHVYDVVLATGVETLVSGTTIQKVVDAVWSPTGNRVALSVEKSAYEIEIFVATLIKNDLGETSLDGFVLERGAHSISFTDDGTALNYVVRGNNSSVGYKEDLQTNTKSIVFEVPFEQITPVWGERTYVYNNPSIETKSYIYDVTNNTLSAVGNGYFGLMLRAYDNYLLITDTVDGTLQTAVYDVTAASSTRYANALYPEKCVVSSFTTSTSTMWCAIPPAYPNINHPDNWYEGSVVFDDWLWQISMETGEIKFESEFAETQEQLDIINPLLSENDEYVIFIDKTTGNIWKYDLREEEVVVDESEVLE